MSWTHVINHAGMGIPHIFDRSTSQTTLIILENILIKKIIKEDCLYCFDYFKLTMKYSYLSKSKLVQMVSFILSFSTDIHILICYKGNYSTKPLWFLELIIIIGIITPNDYSL